MTATAQSAELQEAVAEREELVARTLRAENQVLREALEVFDHYVDPLEAYREDGELWSAAEHAGCLGAAGAGSCGGFSSEGELTAARNACRALAMTNEFAINGHENRVSYIVGSGHRYQVVARKHFLPGGGHQPPDDDAAQGAGASRWLAQVVAAAQAVLDDFIRDSGWQRRQQETVRRRDRDGEAFLRFFLDAEGKTRVRFVEPWQVTQGSRLAPRDGFISRSEMTTFGIHTEPDDVETVLGYCLDDGEYVAAADMQHRKANVDANVRRGVPLFYPVRRNLARAEKLLRNMAAVSDIQTAIALIRKHRGGKRSSIEQLRSSLATMSSPAAGSSRAATYFQPFQPGTILDVHSDAEYDFPARGLDASRYVQVLQAILRAVASRLVMPEFMLTSDASNANYSSTLVAEGPAVKIFERLQHDMIVDDLEVMWRVLRGAAAAGRLEHPGCCGAAGVLDVIDIEVQPPGVAVRNRLEEAQVDEILLRNGAMSVDRLALRHGLDPEVERKLSAARGG
jgi:capsid protein